MGIYGVDIHPRFQAGINIEEIRREGFDFMAVKVSEGTDASYLTAGSANFLRRGRAAGLLCLGYHYLHPGDEDIQGKVFAEALGNAGVPGLLDAEALNPDDRTPTLTVSGIRSFLDACARAGANVPLLYLPHWYWDRLGRPSLAGLPPLWASWYVNPSVASAPASVMYQSHAAAGWNSYGSLGVEVLQFTDRAQVAGRLVDADHYRGTREQFAALLSQPHRRKDHHEVDQLPATAMPADPTATRAAGRSETTTWALIPPAAGRAMSHSASGSRNGAAARWTQSGDTCGWHRGSWPIAASPRWIQHLPTMVSAR